MTTPNDQVVTSIALNRATRRQLGKFGKKKDPLDASFDYFGHDIRVHPKMTNLAILGFVDLAETIDDGDEISSMKAVRDFLHSAVHPDDWEVFWKTALEERQSLEDFMELQWQLLEACSDGDRPLTQPSDSSDGPGTIAQRSKDGSFSRVMDRLDGRPDLQQMVVTAQDSMRTMDASIN